MNRVVRYIISSIFIVQIYCVASVAQMIPTSFTTVTNRDGLSDNRINTVFKDSKGFIWVGTQVGVNRYDGNKVIHFEQIGLDEVFAINETDDTFLWVGSESGLRKFNRKTLNVEAVHLANTTVSVRDIWIIHENNILVATNRGLFHIYEGRINHIIFETGFSASNSLSAICQSTPQEFWLASQSGVCYYNTETKETAIFRVDSQDENHNKFTSLAFADHKNTPTIYLGSYNKGVFQFDINSKTFTPINELADNYILTVDYNNKNLYVGTNGNGLKIFSTEDKSVHSIQHEIKTPNSISSNAIYSFLLDDDTFWIGTYRGGLNYNLNANSYFKTFSENRFNSADYNIRSFYIDQNGDKLLGTRNGLIYISSERNIIKRFSRSDNSLLSSDIILHIKPYRANQYLIGTYGGGLYLFDANTTSLSHFIDHQVFRSGCVFGHFMDDNDIWWFATDKGLFRYNEKSKELYNFSTTNSGLINNNIIYLKEDSKKRLWLGTQDGLCFLDKTSNTIISNIIPESYSNLKVINNVYEDIQGYFWVASHLAIVKITPSLTEITPIPLNQSFSGASSIIEDNKDNIWFATDHGIVKYNINSSKYQTYNIRDGIPDYNFANFVQMTSEDDIWWANERGLIHCHLPDLETGNYSSKPVITGIFYERKEDAISPEFTTHINLPAKSSNIEFEVSLLNYFPAEANIYEYRLENYDSDWKSQIGDNLISYTSLPPGKYRFVVRDKNDTTNFTSLDVVVRWDFMTIFLYVIITIISALILVLLYKNRSLAAKAFTGRFEKNKEKYVYSKIEVAEAKKLAKQLNNYMQLNKPFLNQDLKQADVAKSMGISSGDLSQVLNQFIGTNFTDYVNKFRVEELILKMSSKEAAKYTLSALAEQCGFSSRSSFFRAFKKHTGTTPAEFFKK